MFLVAVGLYLGIAAVEVYRAKEFHVHMAVDTRKSPPSITAMGGMQPPFWPCYVRRVFGQPWRGLPLCVPTPGYEAEDCEFALPEMVMRIGNQVVYQASPKQAEKVDEILKRKAK